VEGDDWIDGIHKNGPPKSLSYDRLTVSLLEVVSLTFFSQDMLGSAPTKTREKPAFLQAIDRST
jgi:hypothetical protein